MSRVIVIADLLPLPTERLDTHRDERPVTVSTQYSPITHSVNSQSLPPSPQTSSIQITQSFPRTQKQESKQELLLTLPGSTYEYDPSIPTAPKTIHIHPKPKVAPIERKFSTYFSSFRVENNYFFQTYLLLERAIYFGNSVRHWIDFADDHLNKREVVPFTKCLPERYITNGEEQANLQDMHGFIPQGINELILIFEKQKDTKKDPKKTSRKDLRRDSKNLGEEILRPVFIELTTIATRAHTARQKAYRDSVKLFTCCELNDELQKFYNIIAKMEVLNLNAQSVDKLYKQFKTLSKNFVSGQNYYTQGISKAVIAPSIDKRL